MTESARANLSLGDAVMFVEDGSFLSQTSLTCERRDVYLND
jgi:hypothetical protein